MLIYYQTIIWSVVITTHYHDDKLNLLHGNILMTNLYLRQPYILLLLSMEKAWDFTGMAQVEHTIIIKLVVQT